jgi:hypothetical protein
VGPLGSFRHVSNSPREIGYPLGSQLEAGSEVHEAEQRARASHLKLQRGQRAILRASREFRADTTCRALIAEPTGPADPQTAHTGAGGPSTPYHWKIGYPDPAGLLLATRHSSRQDEDKMQEASRPTGFPTAQTKAVEKQRSRMSNRG